MVGAMAGADVVALKLVTLEFAVELVKVTVEPDAAFVSQAVKGPVVKDPPVRFPRTLLAVRLLMV